MIEIKTEEPEAAPENTSTTTAEEKTEEAEIAPPLPLPPPPTPPPPPPTQEENKEEQPQQQPTQNNTDAKEETTLNPLNNEPDNQSETESKGKNRRYWTPKEEDRFFQIWGRENWRLTKHGKNTVFFAKWAEEMKEKCNIDVKPEEVQCKVNQTRAKFRQVKRLLDTDRNAIKWKKFDLVEKILKNQYRSKDDEPVPQEALENNRDMSPTELLNNSGNLTSPTNSMSNAEQGINLNQTTVDLQLAEDISLSDHNLTSNVFSNNSQSSTSFSTELFGIDQMEIKQEIETDLKRDGFSEFIPIGPNEQANAEGPAAAAIEGQMDGLGQIASQRHEITPNSALPISQVPSEISNNNNINQNAVPISNNRTFPFAQNHTALVAASNNNNISADVLPNHTCNTNHATAMEPPRRPSVTATTTPRKRNRTTSAAAQAAAAASIAPAASQDALESMYLEEIKKKNVILVEQGEINRKRLRLEERKVKLMEEFFPKYLTLQQDILKKLDNITNSTPEAINIRIEE